jgi:uncharacterized protein
MQVAITGSSGLIGSELRRTLQATGHAVVRVVRGGPHAPDAIRWDPDAGAIESAGLEGLDAVVHLAGESIGSGRWTEAQKARILDSRVVGTRLLADTLAGLQRSPNVMVSGSAIGFYGDRGEQPVTEETGPGEDFFADVVRRWEAAAAPAEEAGVRVPRIRSAIVLSRKGGALQRMLLPFKLGLGGRLGSGRQYWSWISIHDEVSAILHLLENDDLSGPVNLSSPNPVTQKAFATTLARTLGRPAVIPTPTLPLRLLYGSEMVEQTLTNGQRVLPKRLEASGFRFLHPELEGAFRAALSDSA